MGTRCAASLRPQRTNAVARRVDVFESSIASVLHAASSRLGALVDYAALGTRRLPRLHISGAFCCEQHAPAALTSIRLQQPCHSRSTPSPRAAAIAHTSSARRRKYQNNAAANTKISHGRRQKKTRQQVTKPWPATKGPLAEPRKTATTRRRHARRAARGEAATTAERLVRRRKHRRRAARSLVDGGHARKP